MSKCWILNGTCLRFYLVKYLFWKYLSIWGGVSSAWPQGHRAAASDRRRGLSNLSLTFDPSQLSLRILVKFDLILLWDLYTHLGIFEGWVTFFVLYLTYIFMTWVTALVWTSGDRQPEGVSKAFYILRACMHYFCIYLKWDIFMQWHFVISVDFRVPFLWCVPMMYEMMIVLECAIKQRF